MFAVQGILLALLARERTGRGQRVDVGLLDSTVALLTYQASYYFATGRPAGRSGNRHPTIAPYDTLSASDGELILAIGNDQQWQRFCAATGLEALAADPRFATNASRVEHYDLLRPVLARLFVTKSRQAWSTELRAAGVPCGSVRDIGEVLADPQVAARDMIETIDHAAAGHLSLLGVPVKLSETPGSIRTPPPMLGEHTDAVLTELGLTPSEIAALRSTGAI
jgi:formyl-CoA transferase/CoA:oxalate CoA-transferase